MNGSTWTSELWARMTLTMGTVRMLLMTALLTLLSVMMLTSCAQGADSAIRL